MALTTTDFNVSFLLGGSSKVFKFTDITDYSDQGVSGVTGRIKVTAPSGIISYNNLGGSADITVTNARVNTTTILVPLLSNGKPEVGVYTFEYRATEGNDPASNPTVAKIKTFNYSYTKPKATNQLTSDCLSPELKGSDTTNYLVNGVTPIDRVFVSEANALFNTFRVPGEKVGFFPIGEKFDVISSDNNNGQYTVSGASYDQETNQTIVAVANVANTATTGAVGTIVQRRTTLYFTSVPSVDPLVGYSPILTTNSFYSQLQSFSFQSHVLYDFGGGITLSDSFTSSDSINVDCENNLCDVFCCINTVFGEYMKYKCTNKTLADLALERYTIITSHLASLRTAYECGDASAVTKLTEQIKDVAQCNDECDCTTGDPILITGTGVSSGGGNIYNVVSAGNGLNVSTSVSGNTTTYTLALTPSILADIANATATSSVTSEDLIVTSTTTGTNTVYDISLPAATPIIPPKEFMVMKLEIENQPLTPINGSIFTAKHVLHQNPTNLKDPVSSPWTYSVFSADQGDKFRIKISDFQITPNSTYKVDISSYYQKNESTSTGGQDIESTDIYFESRLLTPKLVKLDNGFFDFYFYNTNNDYVYVGDVANTSRFYSKIYLTIKIYE